MRKRIQAPSSRPEAPSSRPEALSSWPGLTRPSTPDLPRADAQLKPGHDGAGKLSRRTLLAGTTLLAAPAILSRRARAAEQCVVGTWGGDYARLLRENIDDPILKPQGIDVIQDVGDEVPRVAKLYAQKKLPHGTEDIACVGALNGYRVTEADLVEPLDETKVPNLKHVHAEPALGRVRAAHLQRAGAGVQSGHGQGTAAKSRRSAGSEMEGQGRRAQPGRQPVAHHGGEPAGDPAPPPISTRPRRSC